MFNKPYIHTCIYVYAFKHITYVYNQLCIIYLCIRMYVHIYSCTTAGKVKKWITITAGTDLILPCIIEMAYPPPLFHWQHIVPHEDEVAGDFRLLENGSLLLTGVKAPAIYKCMAWNEYGTSIQFTYISKHKLITMYV